jgi:hypothetical protein
MPLSAPRTTALVIEALVDQRPAYGPVGVLADLVEQDDARLTAEKLTDDLVGPVALPRREILVRRALLWQIAREMVPLAAHLALVEDRVHDLRHRILPLVTSDRTMLFFKAVITDSINDHCSSHKSLRYGLRSLT